MRRSVRTSSCSEPATRQALFQRSALFFRVSRPLSVVFAAKDPVILRLKGERMEWNILIFVIAILFLVVGGYADTTRRLGRMDRKLILLMRHLNLDPLQRIPLSDRVKQLASDPARKIEAIKVYREETGADLAEAKDAVEAFIKSKV